MAQKHVAPEHCLRTIATCLNDSGYGGVGGVDARTHQGIHAQAYQLRQKVPHLRHFKHREARKVEPLWKRECVNDRLPDWCAHYEINDGGILKNTEGYRVSVKREIVDYTIGSSYRIASLCSLAGRYRYENPMPQSTISPSQGLRIWPQVEPA